MIMKCYSEFAVACQFSNLVFSMFCVEDSPNSAYPFLKGKGAEVKGLTLPLLRIFSYFARLYPARARFPSDSILALLQLQLDIQDLLDMYGDDYFLSEHDALRLQVTVDLLLAE